MMDGTIQGLPFSISNSTLHGISGTARASMMA